MAAKYFEVGDVLPATTQLRISWDIINGSEGETYISTTYDYLAISAISDFVRDVYLTITVNSVQIENIYTEDNSEYGSKIIDTSSWSEEQRTVTYCDISDNMFFDWEDLNVPSGYSITFEENGGSTVTDLTEQTALPDPLPIPTKDNHTFLGWYYDSDFTNEALAGDPLTGDVTLYAKWEEISLGYTITFDSNGGSSIPQTNNATQLPDPLPTPTKSGYTFGGWYYESNFQTRAKAGDTIEANTTLYAKWLTLAQVLEHLNNVVEELRSAIIDKGGDAEGKLLIDFATIINSLKTYEVVETLAELELLEPTLNRIVYVVEGSGELTMGAPVKVTQDGDTLIIG